MIPQYFRNCNIKLADFLYNIFKGQLWALCESHELEIFFGAVFGSDCGGKYE